MEIKITALISICIITYLIYICSMSMPAPHIEETVARGQESGSLSSVASADPSPAGGGHAFISTGDQSGHHITPSHFVLAYGLV